MKNIAIVLAGGVGSRMKSSTPKQFIKINNKEVLLYSLNTFSKCKKIDQIILVSHAKYIEKCKDIISKNKVKKVSAIIEGGNTRQESVKNGVLKASEKCKDAIILVHDSARPFVSEKIILENIKAVVKNGCCTTAIPATDSVYEVNNSKVKSCLNRDEIYLAQTPQSALLSLLIKAYSKKPKTFTDEAGLLSSIKAKPVIVLGDKKNKKITTKEDL